MKGIEGLIPRGDSTAEGPKVSIITVCRNEKLIEETCQSVVNQIFTDFEWLVIDGASTDGSQDVLHRYRQYMSFFVSEPDGGIYEAMNKGINQARGEYLLFLNGGDSLADPLVLTRLFRFETDNQLLAPLKPALQADIIFGEVVSRETGMLPWPLLPMGRRRLGLAYFKMYSLPHQATFIKKSLFGEIGLYDVSYKVTGDYEWFMRAVLKFRATYEYVPLIISRYNFEGASARAASIAHYQGYAERSRAYRKYALNPLVLGFDLIRAAKAGILFCLILLFRLLLPPVWRRRLWQRRNSLAMKLFRASY